MAWKWVSGQRDGWTDRRTDGLTDRQHHNIICPSCDGSIKVYNYTTIEGVSDVYTVGSALRTTCYESSPALKKTPSITIMHSYFTISYLYKETTSRIEPKRPLLFDQGQSLRTGLTVIVMVIMSVKGLRKNRYP